MAKIVTANTLSTGRVVFLSADDQWVENVGEARIFEDTEAAEDGLVIARRDAEKSIVVDPFVTDRRPDSDGKPGLTLRDQIRAFGPTISYLPVDGKTA